MEAIRSRAREFMPQVLLTVLSIIQALALEVLWSSVHATAHLWEGGFVAVLGWLQALAVFNGILVMWIFYVSLVLRYRWNPRVSDSVVPFILGVLEFTLAEMLEPEYLHLFCYVLAAIFVGASATSVVLIRRAFRDDEHKEDFGKGLAGSLRSSGIVAGSLVAVLILAGVAVQLVGPDGAIAMVAVLVANGVLLLQAAIIRYYWNLSLWP